MFDCMSDEKDIECVRRTLGGDTDAFGEIVTRYERSLFNAVYHIVRDREDAREITQTVFMKAFAGLSGFDEGRRFFSWIYRIAMNESFNFRTARHSTEPVLASLAGTDDSPEERAAAAELRRAVDDALATLTPQYRAVIVLRHVTGCSYHEAAEILGVPEDIVRSRLFTARRALRDAMIARGFRIGSKSHV